MLLKDIEIRRTKQIESCPGVSHSANVLCAVSHLIPR